MKNLPPLLRAAPLALLAVLAACNSKTETATADGAAEANTATAAPPIELPPPLIASRTFRCKDNSLLYIDFYGGEKTADLRAVKDGTVTKLVAEEAGKPLTGGGYSVSGTGKEVTITQPGKPSQSCKA
ncbi:hypothetical protein [Sphingomonas solaris]|uniref:Lysozyme inhibitor n=1 Tax=Alterirhizorhabdus solaris TaxID=2529389 RepID=A0A558QZ91_9SPHN|nr:hypothetical protein [Sphingomonas solaris]TVV72429.1 hypothetical protein FOY91_14580 [Sphingomonas solaris]